MEMRWLLNRLLLALFLLVLAPLVALSAPSSTDDAPRITIQELKAKMDRGEAIVILDVRTGQDYESSKRKIKGAIRIPLPQLEDRLAELPIDKEIIAYCSWHDEYTSARAAQILIGKGFKKVRALKGGFHAWTDAGYPMEPK